MAAKRIAIVGFGPRGLGALERLAAHQAEPGSAPVDVTIFETHPTPGAGAAYDPEQASFLLMNFPAAKIDLNWKGEGPASALGLGSFQEWIGTKPDQAQRWYPPRSLVGGYLSSAATELLASVPFPVELLTEFVVSIDAASPGWIVETTSRSIHFDEILLAVGHAPSRRSAGRLSEPSAGVRVDIRGFGLTAIDSILALTEGRGGRFVPVGENSFQYVESPGGPTVMFPHTRHGRPMLVKPELDRSPVSRTAAMATISEGRERVLRLRTGAGITQLAIEVASLAGVLLGSREAAVAAETWTGSAKSGRLDADGDPARSIDRSLRIASGETEPNLEWALGLAWRSIYPAVVERYSHGGLARSERSEFRLLSAELERLAFGPPPENGAKMMALIDAGVLNLSELDRPSSDPSRIELDAVSAPPGLRLNQPPLSSLLAAGAVRIPEGARGIEVTRAARCVDMNGDESQGLAACGRVTEDWVIGNDTLDRGLHPEIDRWAAAVCETERNEASVTIGVAT